MTKIRQCVCSRGEIGLQCGIFTSGKKSSNTCFILHQFLDSNQPVISAGGGGVLNYTNGFRVRAENGEAGTRRAGRGGGCSAMQPQRSPATQAILANTPTLSFSSDLWTSGVECSLTAVARCGTFLPCCHRRKNHLQVMLGLLLKRCEFIFHILRIFAHFSQCSPFSHFPPDATHAPGIGFSIHEQFWDRQKASTKQ